MLCGVSKQFALFLQTSSEKYAMKVVKKKHFGIAAGQNGSNLDKVMAEVNILRCLKHVSCNHVVTFLCTLSVSCKY
jgi:phage terminase large subunit